MRNLLERNVMVITIIFLALLILTLVITSSHVESINNKYDILETKLEDLEIGLKSINDNLADEIQETTESVNELRDQVLKNKSTIDNINDDLDDINTAMVEEEQQATKDYDIFEVTAYDNTVSSQEQWVNQTATGYDLEGETLDSCKCVAVDPNVIPLGSEIEIVFDDDYEHLNGTYTARDTGGAIKGNKIDLFMGDGVARSKLFDFGRRNADVRIIN